MAVGLACLWPGYTPAGRAFWGRPMLGRYRSSCHGSVPGIRVDPDRVARSMPHCYPDKNQYHRCVYCCHGHELFCNKVGDEADRVWIRLGRTRCEAHHVGHGGPRHARRHRHGRPGWIAAPAVERSTPTRVCQVGSVNMSFPLPTPIPTPTGTQSPDRTRASP